MTMRVAVMQPYFYPYLGYFRLFTDVDVFVSLECVQFPSGGWVHRNRFTNFQNQVRWVTLPIVKPNGHKTLINDLVFRDGASILITQQLRNTKVWNQIHENEIRKEMLFNTKMPVVEYLIRNIQTVLDELNIDCPVISCNDLDIDRNLKGVERVLDIVKALGGDTYVNLSGGAALYSKEEFQSHGIELKILEEFQGPRISSLEALLTLGIQDCKAYLSRSNF